MYEERNAKIIKMAKSGMKRKEISEQLELTEMTVSKVCCKHGLRTRKVISDELKEEVAEFRSQNTLRATVEKYNISAASVIKYHEDYFDEKNQEQTHTVRILRSVPSNFAAPSRGFGW